MLRELTWVHNGRVVMSSAQCIAWLAWKICGVVMSSRTLLVQTWFAYFFWSVQPYSISFDLLPGSAWWPRPTCLLSSRRPRRHRRGQCTEGQGVGSGSPSAASPKEPSWPEKRSSCLRWWAKEIFQPLARQVNILKSFIILKNGLKGCLSLNTKGPGWKNNYRLKRGNWHHKNSLKQKQVLTTRVGLECKAQDKVKPGSITGAW